MLRVPNIRQQTYRKPGDARRSFYKWVCKHQLHGKLHIVHHGKWTFHERDDSGYHYGYAWARGYPSYSATRSQARDQWEREAEVHFERLWGIQEQDLLRALELDRQKWHAKDRVTLVERMRHSKFFQLTAGAAQLQAAAEK
jgi:hypothetical protein